MNSGDDIGVVPRTMFRVARLPRIALAVLLACAAVPAAAVTARDASAEEESIAVGTQLMATQDVTLHKAEIQKGSRVSVTKVSESKGRVEGVSLALADGHVVKVPLGVVHTYFRVVE